MFRKKKRSKGPNPSNHTHKKKSRVLDQLVREAFRSGHRIAIKFISILEERLVSAVSKWKKSVQLINVRFD
jgi:hypothetical protein